jgi:hypothetical protein
MSKKHPSNSEAQQEIEKKVVEKLTNEYKCTFTRKTENTNFEFDFFNKEKRIIGEVYAGIDKIKTGSRRKVIADCFKLAAAEKILEGEWNKKIVFVDITIKEIFEGNSWIKEAINIFNIELMVIDISLEDKDALRTAKKKQQTGNIKKSIKQKKK